jgi:GT2 family glycosyltransferase
MLLPRAYLEEVGLMNEDYFLYYEEIDWFTRNAGRFPIVIAAGARLYHREGSAIGSPGWQRAASVFADGHLYRSRLVFMGKYYRRRLPLCYAVALVEAGKQLWHGRRASAGIVLSVLLGTAKMRAPA